MRERRHSALLPIKSIVWFWMAYVCAVLLDSSMPVQHLHRLFGWGRAFLVQARGWAAGGAATAIRSEGSSHLLHLNSHPT